MAVTAKQNTEIVKRSDNAREFHAVNEKDCQGNLLLAYSIEK
jgi:hypothetical protein